MNPPNDESKLEDRSIPSSLELDDDIFTKLKKEDKILDIGCGYGKTCFDLYKKGFRSVVGVDINQKGIDLAQNYATKNGINDLSFYTENAAILSLKNNSYTFAIMQAFLTTVAKKSERQLIFSEASRVLVPGSYLYIAEFAQSWHLPQYEKRYLSAESEGYEKGSFPVINSKTKELEYVARHYTEEELKTHLADARFTIESFKSENFTTRTGNIVNGMVIIAKNAKNA
ncbi:MAG: class I SAM-dependent methyltransferase [Nitrospinales bacterium]